MKKLYVLLCALLLCGCSEKEAAVIPLAYQDADFSAAVIADLHYSSSSETAGSVVALQPLADEVTDAMLAEITDLHPDALIMLGDNTVSGKEEDVIRLTQKLENVKEAGIEIIMIPGNHDYDREDMNAYIANFLPLMNPENSDTASFSSSYCTGGIEILAMDDSSHGSSGGKFCEQTLQWLCERLEEARQNGRYVLFLSHHNVIAGLAESVYSSYLIQNNNLVQLLKEYGAEICLSGHQHSQAVYEYQGIHEILTGMPLSSAHSYGLLKITDAGVNYQTKQIDFERYGSRSLKEKAEELIALHSEAFLKYFRELAENEIGDPDTRGGVLGLISRFFEAYEGGSLHEEALRILQNPYHHDMKELLKDTNYGPWIEALLENPPADAGRISFSWTENS